MPVKQSASKEEFLIAIGLNQQDSEDRRKFCAMWVCDLKPQSHSWLLALSTLQAEVTTYWVSQFETSSRSILKNEYASNFGVQRPYKWAHLNPTTINSAIAEIWRQGQPWPRRFYDLGRSEDPKVYNWVLKWLLWHVCRYRDWRNRKGRASNSAGNYGKGGSGSLQCTKRCAVFMGFPANAIDRQHQIRRHYRHMIIGQL